MKNKQQTIKTWLGIGSINIFGLPFCGKDTQGQRLADMVGGVMVSSGDVLRHDHGNKKVQKLMAAGSIIPSDLFEEIVVPYLSRDELKEKPLILSEVGRVDGEQHVIMRATEQAGHPQKAVILLKLDDDEVWRRFEASQKEHDRGERADDNEAVLQRRISSYHEKVTPVLNYYRSLDMLIEVNGALPRDGVTEEITNELYKRAQAELG